MSKLQEKEGGAIDGPLLKEDPKYEQYYKMMLFGLLKDVAKHATTRDQLDPMYVFCDVLANFDSLFATHVVTAYY